MYSELVYFDGAHFAHIAAYVEELRLRTILEKAYAQHSRRGAAPPAWHRSFAMH